MMEMKMCDQPKRLAAEIADYSALIHYPEHWDTTAYPTLESAVRETLAWAGCSARKDPEAYGIETPNDQAKARAQFARRF